MSGAMMIVVHRDQPLRFSVLFDKRHATPLDLLNWTTLPRAFRSQ
jgi:hypothetical protein